MGAKGDVYLRVVGVNLTNSGEKSCDGIIVLVAHDFILT